MAPIFAKQNGFCRLLLHMCQLSIYSTESGIRTCSDSENVEDMSGHPGLELMLIRGSYQLPPKDLSSNLLLLPMYLHKPPQQLSMASKPWSLYVTHACAAVPQEWSAATTPYSLFTAHSFSSVPFPSATAFVISSTFCFIQMAWVNILLKKEPSHSLTRLGFMPDKIDVFTTALISDASVNFVLARCTYPDCLSIRGVGYELEPHNLVAKGLIKSDSKIQVQVCRWCQVQKLLRFRKC
ncbi:hypothetical protein SASPL_107039 [Salvia splendens]|uniref:Uncharacterized protein n=1 Tax=Salvia splendens TaxID=180675 RepID=A0A8X8Y9N4_SALSN|nr:hypothetical protein SASPL_107039 [Salvia splendens]